MTLPLIKPMLASPSTGSGSRRAVDLSTLVRGWLFDLKLDGLRCIAYWDGHTLRLVNRSGVDITHKFPDVVAPLTGHLPPDIAMILDGELVCDDGKFNSVATRGKQEKPADIAAAAVRLPARLIAFDVLHLDGTDLRQQRYFDRRMVLDGVMVAFGHDKLQVSMMSPDGMTMWKAVTDLGLEGLIAKQVDAPYLDGKRSPSWLKFKTVRRITCIGVSYQPGTGARAHFGAMNLALIDRTSNLVPVGDVGTGFTETEIDHLKTRLDSGGFVLCEIECLNVGANGRLRFPVYRGLRTDLSVAAATLDQLDSIPRC